MRFLMALVLGLALLWGGYWFLGAGALRQGAEAWFVAETAAGRVAERDSLTVQGFPNRFDLTVTAPRLFDPASGFGWEGPFLQLFSLSYKPWHLIAALPPDQRIATPAGPVTVTSDRMQASLILVPGPALALDRTALVGDAVSVTTGAGVITAGSLRLATRRAEADNAHEIGLDIADLTPPATLTSAAREAGLPPMIAALRFTATATLTAPLDRHVADTRPLPTTLDLTEAALVWGDLRLTATGGVVADSTGLAEGRILITVENWRKALALAVALGLVTPEVAPTWDRALTLLAAPTGDPARVELPLVFRDGRGSLGPLPIGPAPRMR